MSDSQEEACLRVAAEYAHIVFPHGELATAIAAWLNEAADSLARHLPQWNGNAWKARPGWSEPAPRGLDDPAWVHSLIDYHYGKPLAVAKAIEAIRWAADETDK